MRKRMADRLGCEPCVLEDHGVIILSAGIAAMSGGRASPEAVDVVRQMGLELCEHESQPLSDRLVRFADLILAMTRGHREGILEQWPSAAPRRRCSRMMERMWLTRSADLRRCICILRTRSIGSSNCGCRSWILPKC